MKLQLGFFVPGPCVPLARPRVVRARGKVVRSFTPEKSQSYKQHVAARALQARCRIDGWRLDWGRYHVETVIYRDQHGFDLDNAMKGLWDGMTGVVWDDDRAVVSTFAEFVDCEEGFVVNEKPWSVGVRVVVEMVGEQDAEQVRRARNRLLAKAKRASAAGGH